jgi:succinoglycan biosynthesis protein ExoM
MVTIDVCLCTFRRAAVTNALASIDAQVTPEGVTLRIVVADNDDTPSSESRVRAAAARMRHPVTYLHAPARNISVARNACLAEARAEWIAFLDDDEVAAPDWIARLLQCAGAGADVVFGPAVAQYPADAPHWITQNDFHSNRPVRRGDTVETGHTCNVLMRFAGTAVATARFDLSLGRSGGEDTDFFFRLHEQGLVFAICEDALVHEVVDPKRMRLRWLVERRFAEGQHYSHSNPRARTALFAGSTGKAAYCGLRAAATFWNRPKAAFWGLRAVFHLGICAGCVAAPSRVAYGE